MEPPYINLCNPLGFPAHKGPPHYGLGENRPGAVLLREMTQGGVVFYHGFLQEKMRQSHWSMRFWNSFFWGGDEHPEMP